jgi:hypothetical protein
LTLGGVACLCARFPALVFLPIPIALNVAVILLSPTDLAADHLSPPTFLRHLSITFPWLVPAWELAAGWLAGRLVGCPAGWLPGWLAGWIRPRGERASWLRAPGATPALRGQRLAAAGAALALGLGLALAVVWELGALGAAAARNQAQQLTVLTADPYLLASDLFRVAGPLPRLPFSPGPGRGSVIAPEFDYLSFRRALFDRVRPYDLHVIDDGRAYTLAAAVFGLAALAALGLGRRQSVVCPSGERVGPGEPARLGETRATWPSKAETGRCLPDQGRPVGFAAPALPGPTNTEPGTRNQELREA